MIPCLCVKVAEGLGRAVVGVREDRTRLDCLADGAGAGLFAVFEAGGLLRDGPVAEAVALGRDDLGGEGLAAVLADDGLAAVLGAGSGNDVLLDMLVLAALVDDVVLADDNGVIVEVGE